MDSLGLSREPRLIKQSMLAAGSVDEVELYDSQGNQSDKLLLNLRKSKATASPLAAYPFLYEKNIVTRKKIKTKPAIRTNKP